MKQRAVIAMGLMGKPKLFIADEPTTALDVTVQRQIFDLLRQVNREEGASVLLISHDIAAVAELCSRIVVMYAGRIVEEADVATVVERRGRPSRTRGRSSPPFPTWRVDRDRPLASIPGRPPDPRRVDPGCAVRCHVAPRRRSLSGRAPRRSSRSSDGWRVACWHPQSTDGELADRRGGALVSLLSVRDVSVRYGAGRHAITAVDGVSLDLPAGGVVGLVGESGSGKSTLAKAIVGLAALSGGAITLDGARSSGPGRDSPRTTAARADGVPGPALLARSADDDRRVDGRSADGGPPARPCRSAGSRSTGCSNWSRSTRRSPRRCRGNSPAASCSASRSPGRWPPNHCVLIADEITSSLDVSVQGSILNVLREIRAALGLTMLFISHNVAVVRYLSDTIAVMYLGQIVEVGPTDELIANPQHPYTKVLLDSVPGTVAGPARRQPADRRRTAGPPPAPGRMPLPSPLPGRPARRRDALRVHDPRSLRRGTDPPEPGRLSLRPAGLGVVALAHAAGRRDGGEQGGGLVAALQVLVVGIGVGDDAGAGLHAGDAVVDEHRADGDRRVEVAAPVDVADDPGVRPALDRLELVDDLHRPHLRRPAHRARRQRGPQHVDRTEPGHERCRTPAT